MTIFEIIIFLLGWFPLFLIIVLYFLFKNSKISTKYTYIIFFGWIILVISRQLIVYMYVKYSPNNDVLMSFINTDGAANAFSLLFGWVLPLTIVIVFDSLRKVYNKLNL